MVKGGRDFYLPGDWNVMCAYCGRKRKGSEMVLDNEFARGQLCCPEHRDERHPQEYARGVKEDMTVPKVQPPIVLFTSINTTFPVEIFPSSIILVVGYIDITTESGIDITTELGIDLTTEPAAYSGSAYLVLPNWVSLLDNPFGVFVTNIQWSWLSGGVGISIDSPNAPGTYLFTTNSAASGVLQVQVTNSLGEVGTATVNVS